LCEVGIDLDGASGNAGSVAAVDDMLDAGVAAWTAKRLFDGVARSIPEPPEFDGNGRAVAIWA
jgi:predicted RNase H-like nuclease